MSKDMTADDIRKNMKNENASFQMNWNNEKNDMVKRLASRSSRSAKHICKNKQIK